MKSIIVGTDFSKGSYVAIALAADIANRMQRGVKLIWVQREKILATDDQKNAMRQEATERLRTLCEQYQPRLHYGKIQWDICTGKVASALDRAATHEGSPLMVIGTNGASGFEKYWMGSTAVRIVQEVSIPVLTVREGFNFDKTMERIVLPIRVDINSRQKVPAAADMARLFDAEVHILGLLDHPSQANSLRAYLSQTAEYLQREGIRNRAVVKRYGNYCEAVLNYAESINADQIVINTEQDKLISQLFLGTNAQQIVHNSQIPVLCIHPADIFFFSKT